MNPQDRQKVERKLQELEAELHSTQPLSQNQDLLSTLQSLKQQLAVWYRGLPTLGKGATIAVGGILALSVVTTVVNLIRLAFTLAVLGVLVYVGYKFFLTSKSSGDRNP